MTERSVLGIVSLVFVGGLFGGGMVLRSGGVPVYR
jgi:hypothetical protein